jgi:hypothetical protein
MGTRGRLPGSNSGVQGLRDTRGVHFELVRHFLTRMFDGEWGSAPGQWRTVAVGLLAMALPAGMLMLREGSPMPEYSGTYRLLAALPAPERFRATAVADELALLVVLMAIAGLVALVEWQALFPSRRDFLALAGLPVRARHIFTARFAALLLFSTGLAIAVNLLPALAAPLEFAGRWQKNPSFWANLWAQAGAACLECLFVFFAVVAIQGALLNLLPGRVFQRVAPYAQGLLCAAMLLAGLRSWSIKDWNMAQVARLPQSGWWAPPVWFTGLHEAVLGDRDPFFRAMAWRAAAASAAAVLAALAGYLLSYRRYGQLLVEAPEGARRREFCWNLPRLLARDPREEAVLAFMAKTLVRSRAHSMIWLAYAGGSAAILLNSSIIDGALLQHRGWKPSLDFLVLFWPLACSAVLLPGMRHVLRVPVELEANWIFRLTESLGRKQWMHAVERFVAVYAIAPVYLLLGPVAVATLGWALAARMLALQLVVSLTIFDLLFYSWQQLPFTCSYVPGKKAPVAIVSSYLVTLGVLVPMVAVIIATASRFVPLFWFLAPLFAVGWLSARAIRRDGWGEAKLFYEDSGEGTAGLGIAGVSPPSPFAGPPLPPLPPHPAPCGGPLR